MTDIEKLFAATRYYKKEQGVTKTCQTCKHWGNNLKKKSKFLVSETRECKQIFKKISAENYDLETCLPTFVKSFNTRATFGCNGYEKATD